MFLRSLLLMPMPFLLLSVPQGYSFNLTSLLFLLSLLLMPMPMPFFSS